MIEFIDTCFYPRHAISRENMQTIKQVSSLYKFLEG